MIAGLRALDLPPEQRAGINLPGILGSLGQPFWNAPQPNGWPDRASDWAAPEAMMRRIDWASGVRRSHGDRDVAELAEANLGPLLRPETSAGGAPRRLAPRRDDPAADRSRIPEALTDETCPAAPPCSG